jgi:hypothetical protein
MGQSEAWVEISREEFDALRANIKLVIATLKSDAQIAAATAARDYMLDLAENVLARLEAHDA